MSGYGSGKDVAPTRHSPDHLLGIIVERAADFEQASRQTIVSDGCFRPDGAHQISLGHQTAMMLNQIGENFECLRT
jgi:hypothetical protein